VCASSLRAKLQYYGTFSRSLFTLLQVFTGESWSEAVTRPLIFGYSGLAGSIFYVSFIMLFQFVLVQVVVAVLLDKILPGDAASETSPASEQIPEGEFAAGKLLSDPVELPRPSVPNLVSGEALRKANEMLKTLREDLEEVSNAIQAVHVRKVQLESMLEQHSPGVLVGKIRQHFKSKAVPTGSKDAEVGSGWW
jgi:hypothetical protein